MGLLWGAQRKGAASCGRGTSLGEMRAMSGDGVSAKFSGSQSDDDDEPSRAGGDEGDEEEGAPHRAWGYLYRVRVCQEEACMLAAWSAGRLG